MTISADTLIGAIVTALAIVVAWMFALHGRMSALERGSEERQEAIVQRFDAMTEEIRIIRQLLQHRGRVA